MSEITLKEFIEVKFKEHEKAEDLVAKNLEIRLHNLNEWKKQNLEERNLYMGKIEYEGKHLLLENKIETLTKLVYIGLGMVLVVEMVLRILR